MIPDEFAAMLAHDERHRWYRGRRAVVGALLDGHDLVPGAPILDAGCGSGRTLNELVHRGPASGLEPGSSRA